MRMKSKLKNAIETSLNKDNHNNIQQKQEIETLKKQLEELRYVLKTLPIFYIRGLGLKRTTLYNGHYSFEQNGLISGQTLTRKYRVTQVKL